MKHLIIGILMIFFSISGVGQVKKYFKLGTGRNFLHYKGSEATNFQYNDSRSPRPIMGFEFAKTSKHNANLKGLLSLDLFALSIGWKAKGPNVISTTASTGFLQPQIFIGSELLLKKKISESLKKNSFGIMGGIAVPIPLVNYDYTVNFGSINGLNQLVETKKVILNTKSVKFTPAFNLGLRYHINNKLGKEVSILELKFNSAFNAYAKQYIDYEIANIPYTEMIKAKGKQIMFSVILPVGKSRKL
jgi:hypothetical protein